MQSAELNPDAGDDDQSAGGASRPQDESTAVGGEVVDAMMESVVLAEVIRDPAGRVSDLRGRFANPSARALFGAEPKGRSLRELMPVPPREWLDICGRVEASGQPERHRIEVAMLGACLECSLARAKRPGLLAIVIHDVTALQRADQRRRHSQAVLESLTNDAQDLIAAQDGEFRYTYFNEAYRREFEKLWQRSLVLGTSMLEALAPWPEDLRKARELWQRALDGESFHVVMEFGPEPGNQFYDLRFSPVHDGEGRRIGAVHLLTNVTSQVRTEHALRESEERFRSVLENMSEGVMLFDAGVNLIFQNRASLRIHGFDPENARIPHSDLPHTWLAWDETGRPIGFDEWPVSRVFRGERFRDQVLRVVHAGSGHEFHASYNGSPIHDSHGRLILGFITIRDITEFKRAEERLRETETRFRQLADSMPQFVWTAEADGTVDYYNRRLEQFGDPARRADGAWEWQPMLHPDDQQPTLEAWRRATSTGENYELEHRIQMKDGSYRWHLTRAFPGRDAEGKIVKWFGTATDIDDQKRAQEILERTVAERTVRLREMVEELEHFSYTITHDMRAPLRAIRSYIEILSQEQDVNFGEAGREYMRRIVASAGRMDDLITDALFYARAVQTELDLAPLDPGPLLRDIVESYPQFQAPRAEVAVAEAFPRVLANPAGLTQCVSNLLSNAVKFVAPGTMPRVRVWGEPRGKHVRLWFEDNGIGIPPDQQERVFVMFQRASKGYEGTGVGLALVRKVIEKMRGRVGFEAAESGGTRFWLELLGAG